MGSVPERILTSLMHFRPSSYNSRSSLSSIPSRPTHAYATRGKGHSKDSGSMMSLAAMLWMWDKSGSGQLTSDRPGPILRLHGNPFRPSHAESIQLEPPPPAALGHFLTVQCLKCLKCLKCFIRLPMTKLTRDLEAFLQGVRDSHQSGA
jgi:hypothetical protein